MPPGYPLESTDANGKQIQVGALVRIPEMPEWLIHDLPKQDIENLRSVTGTVMPVVEIDPYGYVWFGDNGPWFSLRPDEIEVLGNE